MNFEGKDKKAKRLFAGLCFLLVLVGLSIFLFVFLHIVKQRVIALGEIRYQSKLLADQLRQSSDDLTRLVRTYAITGNDKFKKQFWDVLAIRNGEKPRPLNYDRIYWDFLTVGEAKPTSPSGKAVSLHELMKGAGFTEQEFSLLAEAQNNSDRLVALEQVAMNFIKGKNKDISDINAPGISHRQKGIDILFGDKYHLAKIEIMLPINKFLEELDRRTHKNVAHQSFLLQVSFFAQTITFTLILCTIVFLMRTAKQYHTNMVNFLSLSVKEKTVELTESNKALTDSEVRFRSLSDAAFEGIVITEKGIILEANNTMAKMLGYQLSELLGMVASDLVSPEEREGVQSKILSGYELPYESSCLRKDGSTFPIEVQAKMFFYKEQQVRVTAIRDISERKNAEEEIKTLRDILPICSFCKKIRNDEGYYEQIENYIHKHSGVDFSHTICPLCLKKHYPEEYEKLI